MKRLSWFVAVACLVGSAPARSDAPAVHATTLDNGLTVLLAPDSLAVVADVAVWYRAGTRYEAPGASGLTYLFSHLMFGGSKRFPAGEHRRLIEAQGGTFNLVTNPDYTTFYETVPAEAVELALRLEADRMAAIQLTSARLEAARHAVAEERQYRLAVSPVALGVQRLYATAFSGHPYARPVIGLPKELNRLALADVEHYYRAAFSPHRAVLTVVGRFDRAASLATIRRLFEPIPRRPAPAPAPAVLAAQTGERRGLESTVLETPVMLVGWKGPGSADADSPAMDALAEIVTGGLGSKLNQIRASRPDFARLEGDYDRSREASLLFCVATLAPAADTATTEGAVIGEIERLAVTPVSEAELDRARRRIEARTWFSWQTAHGRAVDLGAAQVLENDSRAALTRMERIRQLTPEAVRGVAARCLKAGSRSVVWMHSKESGGTR